MPVYASWGHGSAEEQAELTRIYQKMVDAGGGGTVAVDILSADLKPLKGIHVATASKPGVLLQELQTVVSSLSLQPGPTMVKPRRQSLPQDAGLADLALHLTARRTAESEGPGQFPAESWIVYKATELPQIVGRKESSIGSEWEIPPELAKRLLIHVYPQEVSSDHLEFNKVIEQSITARILSVEGGIARARLDGHLTMNRAPAPPPAIVNRIEANLNGYIDFDVHTKRVLAFKFATNKATSDGRDFMVGITSQPKNYTEPTAQ